MRFFLSLFLIIMTMEAAAAEPLHLSNLQFAVTISGVAVTLSADADVDIHTTADQVTVDGSAIVDLSDLQKQALPLARTIALPSDDCGVSVNSIDNASITPNGGAAHLELSGNITGHICKKVLGQTIKAQQSSNMTAEADIVAQAAEDHVGLALQGKVDAHASNDIVKALMSVFGDTVTKSLSASVAHALDGTQISTSVPTLPDLAIHLSEVSFFGDGPTLKLRARIAASIGPQGLTQLLLPGKKP